MNAGRCNSTSAVPRQGVDCEVQSLVLPFSVHSIPKLKKGYKSNFFRASKMEGNDLERLRIEEQTLEGASKKGDFLLGKWKIQGET